MKNICIQVIIWFGLLANVLAQTCLPDTLVLSSQQQIDDFPANYPGCSEVLGTIIVSAPDLTNLNGLDQLIVIEDYLIFDNNAFTDLSALQLPNLYQVGGHISIQNNPQLSSLSGISDLIETTNRLIIENNASLINMSGLENISYLDVNLEIRNNPQLQNLTGLDNLTSFLGSLLIEDNPSLTSINGLQAILSLNADVEINNNVVLSNISAFSDLTTISGDLIIRGCGSLTNLSGLQSMVILEGDLHLENNNGLINLQGLNNITVVDDLKLIGNDNLTTLNGLNNLATIDKGVIISENNSLENLNGLENLEVITKDLVITELPSVSSFAGLSHLRSIGQNLDIRYMPTTLTDLSDFDSLLFIGIDLSIRSTAFTSLSGLDSIKTLGGRVFIHNNDSIVDLTALQNLTNINGELVVLFGDKLESLDGLHNINPNGISFLELRNNDLLEICNLSNICSYIANGGPTLIENNSPDCASEIEIEAICTVVDPIVNGKVYFDLDNNCDDDDETGVNDAIVRFSNVGGGDLYATSNSLGQYSLSIPPGDYEVEVINFNDGCWALCTNPSFISVEENQSIILDFAIVSTVSCPKLSVDVAAGSLLPCVSTVFEVNYCNKGSVTAEASTIEFTLGEDFAYIASSPFIPSAVNGQTYLFELGDLDPNTCGNFNVTAIYDPACDSFVTGQTTCVEAHIFPDSLCQPPSMDWDGSSIEVSGFCDGDSIRFRIENIGGSTMTNVSNFIIIEDHLMIRQESFELLLPGDSTIITVPSTGKTVRLEAIQTNEHPGQSRPSITIEGCDPDGDNDYSLGIFLQWPQDDANGFIDIECFEVLETTNSNNKTADPLGVSETHCLENETPLEYVIHFQNTGNETVQQVIIQDTISPWLDIASLQAGSASHLYDFEVTSSGVAQFTFDNIGLPTSDEDELASHGFISFKIWQKDDTPFGNLIENESMIYFDSVLTYTTNNVIHTVEEFYCIDTMLVGLYPSPEPQISLNVYPNPFQDFTIFEWTDPNHMPSGEINIYDPTGRLIRQLSVSGKNTVFNRKDLPSGVYFYQLNKPDQTAVGFGKLIVF